MKSGNEDNSLMFLTLADLPSKPKPFPKTECASVTLWSKDDFREWQKTENKKVGATEGNSLTYEPKGRRRRKQSSEESAHPYLQNKDGTLVADLSDMSSKIRSVWESLDRRGMAPQTFGKISSEAWEFIARMVLPLPEFQFLLYCSDGEWKLKEWCKTNYSSWTRNHGLRQPQAKKTETVDDILNSAKLLRMETPVEELNADVIRSKNRSQDNEEDNGDDSSSDDQDDDDETPPPPPHTRLPVCHPLNRSRSSHPFTQPVLRRQLHLLDRPQQIIRKRHTNPM